MMPRIQVQIREDVLVFACLAVHLPKAKAPPVFSISAMMLPIRPQTMISQTMSSSIMVAVTISLKVLTMLVSHMPSPVVTGRVTMTTPIRDASTRPSTTRFVAKM